MKRLLLHSLLLPLLAACGSSTEALSCDSPQYDAALIAQLRSETAQRLRQEKPQLPASEAERLLSAIEFSLSGHTARSGTQAADGQAQCQASLHLQIPADWHTTVSESMLLTQQQTGFQEPADGLRPQSGGYSMPLHYSLSRQQDQVQSSPDATSIQTLARLPAYYLNHEQLSNSLAGGTQRNIEQEVQQMALQADAEAQLEKLRQSHPRIQERLNQTWSNLPPDIRSALEAGQQAWQQQMGTSCRRDAVYGVSPQSQEAERLKCEADMMLARIDEIGRQARTQQQAVAQQNAATQQNTAEQNTALQSELQAAQQQHRAATEDLNTLLRSLSPAVVATLNQNSWQQETTNRCRSQQARDNAAAIEAFNCETAATLARIQEVLQKAR